MLNLKEGIENVDVCKNIIYESEAFIENIKLLGINNNKEEEKVFIEALKSTINDYYRVSDIADLKESNSIILTTPYSYISYDINRPIQIWVDIGSNAWNMKIEKDISNLIVLRKSFKEKQIYTNEMEEYYKKYYLYYKKHHFYFTLYSMPKSGVFLLHVSFYNFNTFLNDIF